MTLAVVWIIGGGTFLLAAGRKPSPMPLPTYSTWLVYWDTLHGRQALESNSSNLDEVELFAYHFGQDDALVPAAANFKELQEAYDQLSGPAKPRLAITLVNDVEGVQGGRLKDPGCIHRVLTNSAARETHIQQILAIADGAHSIDIDYERVAAEDSQAFTAFIRQLGNELHTRRKRRSVVVDR